jgi:hypothetical protein
VLLRHLGLDGDGIDQRNLAEIESRFHQPARLNEALRQRHGQVDPFPLQCPAG